MKNQNEDKQMKQQIITTGQKFMNKVYFIFCGVEEIEPVINTSIISNTYLQILQIFRIIILYTWFGSTNNSTYDIIQTIFSCSIIAICLIPRIFNKYYGFLLTMIIFGIVTIASASTSAVLIQNYLTFQNYCSILGNYSTSNIKFTFRAASLCSQISQLYKLHLISEGVVTLLRIIYIYLIAKAYNASKKKFNEQQKRRRRKQKFDQNLKNKNPYSVNRKI